MKRFKPINTNDLNTIEEASINEPDMFNDFDVPRLLSGGVLIKKEVKDRYLKEIELSCLSDKLPFTLDMYKPLLHDGNYIILNSNEINNKWFKNITDAYSKCNENDFFVIINTNNYINPSALQKDDIEYIKLLYVLAKEMPCADLWMLKYVYEKIKPVDIIHYNMDNSKINDDEVIRFDTLKFDTDSSYDYLVKTKRNCLYIPYLYHIDKSINDIGDVPSFQELTQMLMDGSAFSYDTKNKVISEEIIKEVEPMFKHINELELRHRKGENVDKEMDSMLKRISEHLC